MDKLKQIQEKINEIQTKSLVASDMKAFVKLVLGVITKIKDDISNVSQETLKEVNNTVSSVISYIDKEHESLSKKTLDTLNEAKKALEEIKKIEVKDGYTPIKDKDYFDGKDADEELIVEEVIKRIPKVDIKLDDPEQIKVKLESLSGDDRLDAKAIKNLPIGKGGNFYGGSGIKEVIAGTNVTVDNTNLGYPIINVSGSGLGDMVKATYDPAGGEAQVAFASELHDAVTVTDTAEIDFTLTGQDIQASLKSGSIDVLKLDAGVQTSLGKADSALQAEVDTLQTVTDRSAVSTNNLTFPKLIGGSTTTADLSLQTTSGVGETGADMHFKVGNNGATEAMTILNSGNVGIGTTSPNSKLHVVGAIRDTVVVLSDGATPALDASLGNTFSLTAAGDRTIAVPSNPPSAGISQKITIRHTASGGARTLSLNTGAGGFRFSEDITGLTQTTSGKTDYIGAIYDSIDGFWDVVAYEKGH